MLTKEHLEVADPLRRLIRKELNILADHISAGGCNSWDDYLRATGQIAGLARAEGYLLDMLKKFGDPEDES
jgi:hypothetical protein